MKPEPDPLRLLLEKADAIRVMIKELTTLGIDTDELSSCVRLTLVDEIAEALVVVAKERDEARRQIANIAVGKVGKSKNPSPDAVEYAESRGWDCFS